MKRDLHPSPHPEALDAERSGYHPRAVRGRHEASTNLEEGGTRSSIGPPSSSERIETTDLLLHAGGAGHEVSPSQLKRFVRAGLLVGAEQRHVSGRRGSVSVWPESAADQLVAVCERGQSIRSLETRL